MQTFADQPASPLLNQEETLGVYDEIVTSPNELPVTDNSGTLTYPIEVNLQINGNSA